MKITKKTIKITKKVKPTLKITPKEEPLKKRVKTKTLA